MFVGLMVLLLRPFVQAGGGLPPNIDDELYHEIYANSDIMIRARQEHCQAICVSHGRKSFDTNFRSLCTVLKFNASMVRSYAKQYLAENYKLL